LAGLNRNVFQGSRDPLPPSFAVYPTFVAHGHVGLLPARFVLLHLLAALYHHCVTKDRLLRRMWFGRRDRDPVAPTR
jgi:cytochrome b561